MYRAHSHLNISPQTKSELTGKRKPLILLSPHLLKKHLNVTKHVTVQLAEPELVHNSPIML